MITYNVVVEYNGVPGMASQLAQLLRLIDREGSILSAARLMGIPYSRAWEMIARAERILGKQLVVARRGGKGGGGAKLTPTAHKLLEIYSRGERKLYSTIGPTHKIKYIPLKKPDLIIAYSHDPLLELVLGLIKNKGYEVEGLCLGSGKSLAVLSLEEVDVACIHLYDPSTGEYNKPYIEKYWLSNRVKLVGGYERELVFAVKPGLNINSIEEILELLIKGKLRLANRNTGSGTRVYLDYLINSKAMELGITKPKVLGYDKEYLTHIDVARSIAIGEADVGLVLKYAAKLYGLKTLHVTWEKYECYALMKSLEKKPVKLLTENLAEDKLRSLAKNMTGYRFRAHSSP